MWDDPAIYGEACERCGATIELGAAFCSECGASRSARLSLPPPSHKRRPWAVLGIIAAGLTAIVVGAVIAVAFTGPDGVGFAGATPSTSSSASASLAPSSQDPTVSAAPSSVPSATPTAVPTPPPNAELPNRSIADVQVDELNLRAAGNESAETLGQLRAGARVFTIGAPEATGGTHWYRVAVAAGPYSGARECEEYRYCQSDIGWVASPITGDPWLEAVDLGCPSSPMTAKDLALLTPLERLHCFGTQEITVRGTIDHPCCGHLGPLRYDPPWLALPVGPYFHGESSLLFRMDPSAGLNVPERGAVVEATAHLDDPASPSCRQSLDPEFTEDVEVELSAPAWVVLSCRMQLVITEYEVIGTEDLGPIGREDPVSVHA